MGSITNRCVALDVGALRFAQVSLHRHASEDFGEFVHRVLTARFSRGISLAFERAFELSIWVRLGQTDLQFIQGLRFNHNGAILQAKNLLIRQPLGLFSRWNVNPPDPLEGNLSDRTGADIPKLDPTPVHLTTHSLVGPSRWH